MPNLLCHEMIKNLLPGAVIAVFGALTIAFGQAFGLELDQVALLGVALGAVIGLVPDRSNVQRIAAFLVGFMFAWIGYGVRAAVLPDSATGRALAILLVIVLCMAIAAVAEGRFPLWAMLVGVAAMVGSYETTYIESPSQFVAQSPTAATTVLLAAAIGHLATMLLGSKIGQQRELEYSSRGEHTVRDNEGVSQ